MTDLKTKTVGPDEDNPSHSYCLGHVSGETYAKAHQAEGWSEGDVEPVDNDDPKSLFYHGYVKETGTKAEFSRKAQDGYHPATIREW